MASVDFKDSYYSVQVTKEHSRETDLFNIFVFLIGLHFAQGNLLSYYSLYRWLVRTKALNLLSEYQRMLRKSQLEIRDLAHVICLLLSSTPGFQMGMLFYRKLENSKIDPLRESCRNFDADCTISETCRSDLRWCKHNECRKENPTTLPTCHC